MIESELSLNEKTPHNIGFPTFKLFTSPKHVYD